MEAAITKRRRAPLAALLALACALMLALAPGAAWAEAYTWTDSDGATQTSGITTQATVYYDGSSTTKYSDLTTIVLSSSGTFTLTGDLQADIIVGNGASSDSRHTVTIDLNGYTLTGTGKSSVIIALAYSDVTICDSSTAGAGTITGGVGTYADGSGTTVVTSGYGASTAYHMFSESTCGRSGGAVFIDVRATVTMTGGSITGNSALGTDGTSDTIGSSELGRGGGVFVNVKDSGSNNSSSADDSYGDGEATFTMTGGSITANEAGYGGGIYGASGGIYDYTGYTHYNPKAYLSGSDTKIDENSAQAGGGIYGFYGGTVQLSDGVSVSSNTASGGGGGLYVSGHISINAGSGDTNAAAVVISNNTCKGTGGGIYSSGEYSIFTMKNNGATITGNTAKSVGSSTSYNGYGGGIYANAWYVNLSGGSVSNNYAQGTGGGIYLTSSNSSESTYNLFGTLKVTDNSSYSDGGGIYVGSGTSLKMVNIYGDVEISGNSTREGSGPWGGGICTERPLSIYGNAVIKNNSAAQGGGVYVYAKSSTNVDSTYGVLLSVSGNAQITGNTAVESGGGVYLRAYSTSYQASLSVDSATAVIANNAAGTSGADLFTYGKNETLVLTSVNGTSTDDTSDDVEFTDGTTITGWYDDSSSARWSSLTTSGDALTSFSSGTSYALIAAYAKTSENSHTYGDPTWTWTGSDEDGYTKVEFSLACTTCTGESAHAYEVELEPTVTYVSATCTVDGYTKYSATVVYNGSSYTDSKEVASETDLATGHSYYLSTANWGTTTNKYDKCTFLYYCENEGLLKSTTDTTITQTLTESGLTITATYTCDDKTQLTATTGPYVAMAITSAGVVKSYYTTADNAFASTGTNGYTTKLLVDCTMTTAGAALTTSSHTLDLNGCTLTYTGESSAFTVGTATTSKSTTRTLNVTDSSDEGTGAIVSTNGASIFTSYGALNISGGNYSVTASSGATAEAIIVGATHMASYNSEAAGAAVTISGGTFTGTLFESTSDYTETDADACATLAVSGGLFNMTYLDTSTTSYSASVTVTGGYFTSEVASEYVADGYSAATATATTTTTDDDGNETTTTGAYTVDGVEYGYTVSPVSLEFLGGSLRMDSYATTTTTTDDDGNETSTTTYDTSAADLRFGYTLASADTDVAEVVADDSTDGAAVTWGWYYWTAKMEESAALSTTATKYTSDDDGTVTSNLVVAGIKSANFATDVYARMFAYYTNDDGVTVTVEEASAQQRCVTTSGTTTETGVAALIAAAYEADDSALDMAAEEYLYACALLGKTASTDTEDETEESTSTASTSATATASATEADDATAAAVGAEDGAADDAAADAAEDGSEEGAAEAAGDGAEGGEAADDAAPADADETADDAAGDDVAEAADDGADADAAASADADEQ